MTGEVFTEDREPSNIIKMASKPTIFESRYDGIPILEGVTLGDGRHVYQIRQMHENIGNKSIQGALKEVTGFDADDLHRIIEIRVPHDKRVHGSWGKMLVMRGGDPMISGGPYKDKDVETLFIGPQTFPGDILGEFAFVRMWGHGVLKTLTVPFGNPGNFIDSEITFSLNGGLCYVVGANIVSSSGKLQSNDFGVKFILNAGDAIVLPLGTARQVIATHDGASQDRIGSGAKYLIFSAPWTGENGITQNFVHWPNIS